MEFRYALTLSGREASAHSMLNIIIFFSQLVIVYVRFLQVDPYVAGMDKWESEQERNNQVYFIAT